MSVIDRYLGLHVDTPFALVPAGALLDHRLPERFREGGNWSYDVQAIHVLLRALQGVRPLPRRGSSARRSRSHPHRPQRDCTVGRRRIACRSREADHGGRGGRGGGHVCSASWSPRRLQRAETRRSIALSAGLASRPPTASGRAPQSFRQRPQPVAENDLRDISIYEIDHRHHAQLRPCRCASHGSRWLLRRVETLTQERVVTKHLARASSALPSSERSASLLPREDLSFADLRRQPPSARGENASRIRLSAHHAVRPVHAVASRCAAGPRTRASASASSAALGGIGSTCSRTFMQLGLVYGWGPVAGAVLPTAVALGLASWAFRGVP